MQRSSLLARLVSGALALCALGSGFLGKAEAQTIRNTASLSFSDDEGRRTIASNEVTLDPIKRPTWLSFHQLPRDFQFTGMKCETGALNQFTPAQVSAEQLAAAPRLESLDVQNSMIVELDAQAENRDPDTREWAWITATIGTSSVRLPLMETEADSGEFAGAVPASGTFPQFAACNIRLTGVGQLHVRFDEDTDSMASTATLLIDPEGYVFDSQTGTPIDGVTVTLIDDATGQPAAMVYGDDGLSQYPSTVVTGSTVTDASGTVYAFTPGNFRFPLAPPGNYRLQVSPVAGYTIPSIRTPEELAGFDGPPGKYRISPGSYGDSFALVGPEPVHIDIPIDPIVAAQETRSALLLSKTASVADASAGDFVAYALELRNVGTGTANAPVVTDVLPRGLRYRPGTTRGASEPEISRDGSTLRFKVPSISANGVQTISYVAAIGPETPAGEAVNRAIADDGVSRSAEASAAVRIHAALFTDALTLIGRVTEGDCRNPDRGRKGVAGVRVVLEDGSFTLTDRDGLYHFEGVRPGTHVVQLDADARPPGYAPVPCDRDARSAGSHGVSRFVEGLGGSLQRVDFQLRRVAVAPDAAKNALPATLDDATAAGGSTDWLALAEPGALGWLFPDAGHNPRSPAVRVVVRHAPGQAVALTLGGKPVEALAFDGTDEDAARGVAVSRWTGLPLVEGDNRLEARVLDASGATVATLDRVVHYANTPAQIAYVAERSQLVADGLTRPQIAVRVTDRDGKPVRAGAVVSFRVEQPHAAAQEGAAEQTRQLAGLDRTEATARVSGDEGIALIALQPTTQAGTARITVTLPAQGGETRATEIRPWLSAPARDWMIVGFGKGTLGYQTLRKRTETVRSHDVVTDGQLALYAKGRIKGSWLLTLAYDSDRRFDRDRGLLGTIDPARYYTVYGDGTVQGQDAATRGKLYLRLEHRAFYALFGDFETGFTDTKLARYSRTLSGAKAEYVRGAGHVTVFAAKVDERYARDEIQGNGLSGPYRLSQQDIVPNSDKLRLETRNRYRPDQVVDSKTLTRHIDYDIDPIAGTIRFREPVLSRDAELNPVFIVVDYETYGPGKKRVAGARAAITAAEGKAAFGATLLHDETIGNATVAAFDVKVRPIAGTEIRAEAATGGKRGIDAGQAFSTEIEHHGKAVDVLAYARQQGTGFGLGQQNYGEAGTRRVGVDGRVRLDTRWSASGTAWVQDDMVTDVSRIAGEGRVEYRRDQGSVFVGGQFASDRGLDGERRVSQLLTLGATKQVLNGKVELSGQSQLALGGKDESTDFPARQQIGATWKITPDIRLLGLYEIAEGNGYTAHAARIGFDVAPWSGGRVMSSVNQQAMGENGRRTYAQYGLSQSLPVSKAWTIDATLDASGTLSGHVDPSATVNPFQPRATGGVLGQDSRDGDFVAMTLGATWRGTRWSWNGRAEVRNSDRNRRLGLTSNLLRTLGEGSTLASSINAYRITDRNHATVSYATADLALALRPADSRWSLLERFQLRHEQADAGASSANALAVPTFAIGDQSTIRAVNNVAVSYRTGPEGGSHGFETSLYYGAKFVRGRYAGEALDGFIDVIGAEIRKDLARNFDIGGSASVQHSWTTGGATFAYGPSLGFSPGGNLWVSGGYNVSGYRDRDFEDARYTRQGPYLTMRVRLDKTLLDLFGDRK